MIFLNYFWQTWWKRFSPDGDLVYVLASLNIYFPFFLRSKERPAESEFQWLSGSTLPCQRSETHLGADLERSRPVQCGELELCQKPMANEARFFEQRTRKLGGHWQSFFFPGIFQAARLCAPCKMHSFVPRRGWLHSASGLILELCHQRHKRDPLRSCEGLQSTARLRGCSYQNHGEHPIWAAESIARLGQERIFGENVHWVWCFFSTKTFCRTF